MIASVKDWVAWHRDYEDPASPLSMRLECVKYYLAEAIDRAPSGPVQLVSLCAGQGHDVIGVLPDHTRRDDVRAVLVEADGYNARVARDRAAEAGLVQVEVRQADAGSVASFADALPADVLLLCGIFGNVSDADIRRTAQAAPQLCADGATVIWTRNRRAPDLTPQLRAWFVESGLAEVGFVPVETDRLTAVGVNQLTGRPALAAALPEGRLFRFRP